MGPEEKVCPFCAETIRAAAIKCRYCGSELTPAWADAEPTAAPATAPTAAPTAAPTTAAAPPASSTGDAATSRMLHRGPNSGSFGTGGGLTTTLGIGVVVFGVLFGWLLWLHANPPDGKAPNGVITSTAARTAGQAAATALTQKALSYNYKTIDADIKAAEATMTGSFKGQYIKAMASTRASAVKNQVVLKATALATSIVSATEHKVQALVFVNQITTAKGTTNQQLDQNRVLVTLTRADGDWQLSAMKAF